MNSADDLPAENPDGPVSGERYGDYEVIKPIGSGGMADIFLARKLGVQGFQKLVVVKRIRRELVKDEHLIDMFIDEAHVAAKLDHPNVVVISDLGEVDDSYFMAMEYLRGQTLRSLQKRLTDLGKMLPPQFWARIMEAALDGLHYAHELRNDDGKLLGLVHRDFTPSNIMITYGGVTKVIDFGVAHVESPTRHETRVGTIKGKIAYLAPEQCMATPLDRRADVFAAGIVLWELLSRKRLFDGPSDAAIIVAIMKDEIPKPGWEGQPLDWELQDIVMKALHRDPNHRYQTAAHMRDDLRDYLRKKLEKVDVSDISDVMMQLFKDERVADERLATTRIDTGSRSNPGRRGVDSSRSGSSRSGASRSGRSISSTNGSARGQKVLEGAAAPPKSRRGMLMAITGAAAFLLGFGVWRFASPPAQPQPPSQQQQYAHPQNLEPAHPQPVDSKPIDPKPEVAKPETPQVAEKPLEKPTTPKTPKNTAPSEGSGGYGSLDFDTRPYTQVFIGRKKLGDTPMLGVKVPAGNLTLILINEEAGIHETYTVTVPKGGHVFKKLKL